MLNWIRKRVLPGWTRHKSWSPLLQCQREFQRTLSKERSRVDRHGGLFGFIILRLVDMRDAKHQVRVLAKLLHKRLRETDEKGQLGPGRIGIVLPTTDSDGTHLVLAQLLQLANQHGLSIDGEAFIYPDQELRSGQREQSTHDQVTQPAVATVSNLPLEMTAPAYPWSKRLFDIAGAMGGLVLGAPVLLCCAVAVKLTSRGPVLFCQQRSGYLGRPFTIYKFRSMVDGAAELQGDLRDRNERDGPAFKITRDPRTTRVGRILRATGFDELPQLYNVLRGDMGLVGPRPLPVNESEQIDGWQRRRLEAKPGLTCYWQIAKSRQVSFADWMRMDLKYARRASLLVDLRLIAKTVVAVFLGRVGH